MHVCVCVCMFICEHVARVCYVDQGKSQDTRVIKRDVDEKQDRIRFGDDLRKGKV